MNIEFKPEELITKKGKTYPVVGGRLRVAHEENGSMSIKTDLVQFEPMSHSAVKATVTTEKGDFSAYGAASASKDERLLDSLLELAETRAIARALRFAGYGVEFTGLEEIGDQASGSSAPGTNAPKSGPTEPATTPQVHAIEKIANLKHWDPVECCRRILGEAELSDIHELTKQQAVQVIGRMKAAA